MSFQGLSYSTLSTYFYSEFLRFQQLDGSVQAVPHDEQHDFWQYIRPTLLARTDLWLQAQARRRRLDLFSALPEVSFLRVLGALILAVHVQIICICTLSRFFFMMDNKYALCLALDLQVINSYLWIYSKKDIIKNVDIDVGLDSRIVIVLGIRHGGSNICSVVKRAYGSCSIKLLTDELKPSNGNLNRNDRLRLYLLRRGYFSQHHVDTLNAAMSPVQFLASRFPGKTEHEYRGHLCNFQISGMTGLQLIGTLSGGQKSRVPLAALSLMNPHVLLLDEPINHLDIEGLDPLMAALNAWNRGAVIISHDERFTTTVAKELWVCADGTVSKFKGDVQWGDTFSL
ncbi:P-loop containing nucleoside triphosphate hydrolase protein [Melanogaster broomeanus]|nr:P-loop containing nucleoside triphosphate hydrolase protein [Melanogaster broomeanus]